MPLSPYTVIFSLSLFLVVHRFFFNTQYVHTHTHTYTSFSYTPEIIFIQNHPSIFTRTSIHLSHRKKSVIDSQTLLAQHLETELVVLLPQQRHYNLKITDNIRDEDEKGEKNHIFFLRKERRNIDGANTISSREGSILSRQLQCIKVKN